MNFWLYIYDFQMLLCVLECYLEHLNNVISVENVFGFFFLFFLFLNRYGVKYYQYVVQVLSENLEN